jgi:hypothetical protein
MELRCCFKDDESFFADLKTTTALSTRAYSNFYENMNEVFHRRIRLRNLGPRNCDDQNVSCTWSEGCGHYIKICRRNIPKVPVVIVIILTFSPSEYIPSACTHYLDQRRWRWEWMDSGWSFRSIWKRFILEHILRCSDAWERSGQNNRRWWEDTILDN